MKSKSGVLAAVPTDSLVRGLFYAAVWTASFDIFLNIRLGANLRACQLFLILAWGLFLFSNRNYAKAGFFRSHPGFVSLWLWLIVVLIMSFTAHLPQRGIGYAMWGVLSGLVVFLPVQIFKQKSQVEHLARVYVYGFAFVAAFGLVQFVMPIAGLPAPLVAQWWIEGVIPRLNGFSQEPSFYSTYLLLGYPIVTLLAADRQLSSRLLSPFKLIRWLIFVAIVLSSSRMGIAFMLLWELGRGGLWFVRGLYLKSARVITAAIVGSILLIGAVGVGMSRYSEELSQMSFLLSGLGVGGGADHSVSERRESQIYTLEVFKQAPITGVGLGSVAEKIAELHGVVPQSFEETKDFEGQAVFLEILAGSGVIGFAAFLTFYFLLCKATFLAAMRQESVFMRKFCIGLLGASLLVIVMLQLNQNILRPYFWTHCGIMATVALLCPRKNRRPEFELAVQAAAAPSGELPSVMRQSKT